MGDFYAHFDSKAQLIAETIDAAFDQTMVFLKEAAASSAPRQRKHAILGTHMGKKHRNKPGIGCAIAALGREVSRLDTSTRRQFEARGRVADRPNHREH